MHSLQYRFVSVGFAAHVLVQPIRWHIRRIRLIVILHSSSSLLNETATLPRR